MSAAVGVAEAFTGLDALGRDGRSALAGVLHCRPDRLEQASLGDLTDRRHRQRLVAAVISAVEFEPVLSSLAGRALSELSPAAASLPDGELAAARCPARLVRPLRQYAGLRWSSVLALRLDDVLGWTGVGPHGAAQLLGLAVERALRGLAERDRGRGAAQALADLGALVRYEDPAGRSIMRSALVELSGGRHPDEVRRAASRLLRTRNPAAEDGPAADDLAQALEALFSAVGDARDQAVFAARELALGERPRSISSPAGCACRRSVSASCESAPPSASGRPPTPAPSASSASPPRSGSASALSSPRLTPAPW